MNVINGGVPGNRHTLSIMSMNAQATTSAAIVHTKAARIYMVNDYISAE
jgi:hypothetical protein